ncbi:MAG: hypothetical protein ABSE17_02465 [Candidatus Levyibacteriota bacterium]
MMNNQLTGGFINNSFTAENLKPLHDAMSIYISGATTAGGIKTQPEQSLGVIGFEGIFGQIDTNYPNPFFDNEVILYPSFYSIPKRKDSYIRASQSFERALALRKEDIFNEGQLASYLDEDSDDA